MNKRKDKDGERLANPFLVPFKRVGTQQLSITTFNYQNLPCTRFI
jgi:hypothetical protein